MAIQSFGIGGFALFRQLYSANQSRYEIQFLCGEDRQKQYYLRMFLTVLTVPSRGALTLNIDMSFNWIMITLQLPLSLVQVRKETGGSSMWDVTRSTIIINHLLNMKFVLISIYKLFSALHKNVVSLALSYPLSDPSRLRMNSIWTGHDSFPGVKMYGFWVERFEDRWPIYRVLGSDVFSRGKETFGSSQRGEPGHCINGEYDGDILKWKVSRVRGHNAFHS